MPDLAVDVSAFEELDAWQAIVREHARGDVPHCRAVSAPLAWHAALLIELARMSLSLPPDAPASAVMGHPDLLVAGELGKPPKIGEASPNDPYDGTCRALISHIALRPVKASCRLGVVMSADRLNVNAANSLLKLAEEPPTHARLLFLLESGWLLPTLRSRARSTVLAAPLEPSASPPPMGDDACLAWLEAARGKDALGVAEDVAAWGAWAMAKGDAKTAARMERIRLIAETKDLSVAMLCDLSLLALREAVSFEHVFDDVR